MDSNSTCKGSLIREFSEKSNRLILDGQRTIHEFRYIWTINRVDKKKLDESKIIKSPIFITNTKYDLKWCLALCVAISYKPEKIYSVEFKLLNMINVNAKYDYKMFDTSKRMGKSITLHKHLFGRNKNSIAFIRSDHWEEFGKDLLFAGHLGISCSVCIEEEKNVTIAKDLSRLLETGRVSDVKLVVKDEEFPAHKAILAARSRVFAAMFEHDTLENQKGIVIIEDIHPKVVKALLDFIYTEKTGEINELAQDLFIVADKYNINDLKNLCVKVLRNDMDINNAIEILILANMHNSSGLLKYAQEFIHKNIANVKETEEYKALSEKYSYVLNELLPID